MVSAGVAERFRRRPAEPLYMGSTPIPGSNAESLYSSNIVEFLWTLKKEGLKESTIKGNYAKVLIESGFEYVTEVDSVKLFRKRK
jgi:hypothetical protein